MNRERLLGLLNEAQREAVLHKGGPALVIAGPGSGKTRVLTFRIAYLLLEDRNLSPDALMALTFTNRAAEEMRRRLQELTPRGRWVRWVGTFHSLFARILRQHAEKLGYTPDFTIVDRDDMKDLLKQIVQAMKLDEVDYRPPFLAERISRLKHARITWKEYRVREEEREEDERMGIPEFYRVYERYQKKLKESNAMDFEDLMLNTWLLFQAFPEVMHQYQHQFLHILVDEFQDTDTVQYEIVRMLAGAHRNLYVVGDDCQSIYRFRGACVENIFQFMRDFPEHHLYKLEQNYRSTRAIVRVSSRLIEHNERRIPKNLWTSNPVGEPVRILEAFSDEDEARQVAHRIFDLIMQKRVSPGEIAVLYRRNSQSRLLEEHLRKRGIPYRVVGSVAFYQRKEIKDVLAYFRVVLNPQDEVALLRILNFPPRKIGKKTVEKLQALAERMNRTLWEVIMRAEVLDMVSPVTRQALIQFRDLILGWRHQVDQLNAYEMAKRILEESGIQKYYEEARSVEEQNRWENIQELLSAIRAYIDQVREGTILENTKDEGEISDSTLRGFVHHVSLITDLEDWQGGKTGRNRGNQVVRLMTLHMAKGLEFDHVFITGLEDDILPDFRSCSPEDVEEERRLLYVGMTRARHSLTLLYALRRYQGGKVHRKRPSPFLEELGKELVVWERISLGHENGVDGQRHTLELSLPSREKEETFHFEPDDPALLKPGMIVLHHKFGPGRILEVEGEELEPGDRIVLVEFQKYGKKRIMLRYARFKILQER